MFSLFHGDLLNRAFSAIGLTGRRPGDRRSSEKPATLVDLSHALSRLLTSASLSSDEASPCS